MRPEGRPFRDVPGKVAEWSKRRTRNPVYGSPYRGIESHPFRQMKKQRPTVAFLLVPAPLRLCLIHVRISRNHRPHPTAATGARTALVRARIDCFARLGIAWNFPARCAGTGGDTAVGADGKAGAGRDGARAAGRPPPRPISPRAPPAKPALAPRPALTKPAATPQPVPQRAVSAEAERMSPPETAPESAAPGTGASGASTARQARPDPRRRRKPA